MREAQFMPRSGNSCNAVAIHAAWSTAIHKGMINPVYQVIIRQTQPVASK